MINETYFHIFLQFFSKAKEEKKSQKSFEEPFTKSQRAKSPREIFQQNRRNSSEEKKKKKIKKWRGKKI